MIIEYIENDSIKNDNEIGKFYKIVKNFNLKRDSDINNKFYSLDFKLNLYHFFDIIPKNKKIDLSKIEEIEIIKLDNKMLKEFVKYFSNINNKIILKNKLLKLLNALNLSFTKTDIVELITFFIYNIKIISIKKIKIAHILKKIYELILEFSKNK